MTDMVAREFIPGAILIVAFPKLINPYQNDTPLVGIILINLRAINWHSVK